MHKILLASAAAIGFLGAVSQTAAEERWLRVHNNTSADLCFVQISHVGTGDWGPDLLGSSCLKPGRYRTVDPGWQVGYCKMDMRFIFDDDDYHVEWDYNICEEEDYYLDEGG